MKTLEYITTNGKKLTLRAVPQLVITRMAVGLNFPEAPYYEHEVAGGEKEKIYHNETTVETPEEKAAWAKYQQAMDDIDVEFQKKKILMYIRYGVDVDVPEDWKGTAQEYIEQVCIETYTDALAILRGIDLLSGVDQEAIKKIEDSFRHQMERGAAGKSQPASVKLEPQ